MKKLFLFMVVAIISLSVSAQGNKGGKGKSKNNPAAGQTDHEVNMEEHGKGKNKVKDKEEKDKLDKDKNNEHDRKVWDGVKGGESCGKISKNQPAKVRSTFQSDYPNAMNVRWTKCRGDWTASFGNGLFISTAIYHANGERRDTRTPITKEQTPKTILDSVFKRKPKINLGDIIKIEKPGMLDEIFRVKDANETGTEFLFFNKLGEIIKYDY